MRLVVTSDLHLDQHGKLTKRERIQEMIEKIKAESADVVVLAGDLAHGFDAFEECVGLFRVLDCPKYVLAGNHDIWRDKTHGISSETLWNKLLPEATARQGAKWLEDTTATFGDIGLVGSMCWYDYSAMDKDVGVDRGHAGAFKARISNDAHWIDWKRNDIAFAQELEAGLLTRLRTLETKTNIVVTHMPIFEEQMHRKRGDKSWGFANAYFGNLTTGARILKEPSVRAVISGHTHWGIDCEVLRHNMQPILTRVVGSDYGLPNYTRMDL